MSEKLTKEDLPFLVKAMERKSAHPKRVARGLTAEKPVGADDKVSGNISIPKPLVVDVNGTMSEKDYKACSTIMAVCQNMVQKTITDAAKTAGVEVTEALKNINAWVQGYVDFPFPFFTFKDTQSNVYSKKDFSLNVNPDVVEQIVNIKGLVGLKDAVIGALKKSGGDVVSYQGTDQKFNYFGIITGYNETEISTRVIKFQMNLKSTDAKALCVTYKSTNLDSSYDTYQFVADKELMIKMQEKMGDKLVEYFAQQLLTFAESFYDQQLANFQKDIADRLKQKTPVTP